MRTSNPKWNDDERTLDAILFPMHISMGWSSDFFSLHIFSMGRFLSLIVVSSEMSTAHNIHLGLVYTPEWVPA